MRAAEHATAFALGSEGAVGLAVDAASVVAIEAVLAAGGGDGGQGTSEEAGVVVVVVVGVAAAGVVVGACCGVGRASRKTEGDSG